MTATWSGRRVQRARAIVATWLPAPCGRCRHPVEPDHEWVVGHKVARAIDPSLMWVVSNWQPEHDACSRSSAQSVVVEKAKLAGAALLARARGFSHPDHPAELPELPVSPSVSRRRPDPATEARSDLAWSPSAMRRHPWLSEFTEVPPDASPPLWMSPVPKDAVCSYGWSGCTHMPVQGAPRPRGFVGPMPSTVAPDAVVWIEETQRIKLRWWQRLAIVRQLEHRADGSLCWRTVLESCPRRAGKSVRIRGVALWRLEHGPTLFGERQVVLHTGSDVAICRAIQKDAWRWARSEWARDGHKPVTVANGKEAITTPAGDEWLVRSQTGVYGYDTTLGVVDEGWDVDPGTVSEGLEPSTMERSSPQLHLTSTAHRRATSLMRGRLSTALAIDDSETLLLVWSAPAGADVSDPAVWRAASPHWTEDRRRMIAAKYAAALAGEADPEADDPDPMAGFEAQYLNRWRLTERREPGEPLVDELTWSARAALPDLEQVPDGAAIESWSTEGVSLALAWREGGGAVVAATDHRDVADAVAALRASGFRGRVTVGASLAEDPALRRVPTTATKARTAAAAVELGRLVTEGALQHDGGEHLTEQVLAVRTMPGVDGPRLISKGRADAVKAATWAVASARSRRSSNMSIVLPTGIGA